MIIDVHGHVCASPRLYNWLVLQLASRSTYGTPPPTFSDDEFRDLPDTKRNIAALDKVGTDIQLLSPRPFSMFHAEKPARIVHRWIGAVNSYIAQSCRVHPTRFAGVAGLPQPTGEPIQTSLPELERCVNEFGFVGCLLDPDPGEGDNSTPTLGDEYWYPLWEKLVELNIPAHIHSSGNRYGRETYSQHFISEESLAILSLVNSRVFLDFPALKIVVSHGGGSVPYQVGRWRAERLHPVMAKDIPLKESFDESLKRLYFDTVLHSKEALQLLINLVGPERVIFGTENPGSGTAPNPDTGRNFDDIKPLLELVVGISQSDRENILSANALRVYPRLQRVVEAA
ncbi:amidohydrolase family protein [Paraburkholderia sp. BCC1885]|uniref:amidohydrolase family protein n=1 Tax=Paraburkholderia sp. BCC1885 TaxID=2562669 RepID=UPI001181ED5B|nr:amidohydrolase family protein [Paraburkholderia sp. BCC1885]